MKTNTLSNNSNRLLVNYVKFSSIISIIFLLSGLVFKVSNGFQNNVLYNQLIGVNLLFLLFSVSCYLLVPAASQTWKNRILTCDPFTWIFHIVILVLSPAAEPYHSDISHYSILFFLLLSVKGFLLFSAPDFSKTDRSVSNIGSINLKVLFLMVLTIYLPLGYIYESRFDPTGDEPHYLLITHSLVYDADIDILNNYESEDYKNFFKENLEPQPWEIRKNDRFFSYHSIGYSLFLAPGYFLGGRLGALWQNQILAAILSIMFLRYLLLNGGSKKAGYAAFLIVSFSPPLMVYSCLLYPEILAACISFYVFQKVTDKNKLSTRKLCLLFVLMFILPVIKIRYAPLVILLFSLFLMRTFLIKQLFAGIFLFFMCSGLIYLGDRFVLNGVLFSATYDPIHSVLELVRINPWNLIVGVIAFFIDQEFGLFWTAPLYFFIVFGVFNKSNWKYIFISLGYIFVLVQLKKLGLHGLESPPPRYLVCLLPFMGYILYSGLCHVFHKSESVSEEDGIRSDDDDYNNKTNSSTGISNRLWLILDQLGFFKLLFTCFASLTFLFSLIRWSIDQGFSEIADGRSNLIAALNTKTTHHVERLFPSLFSHHTSWYYALGLTTVLLVVSLIYLYMVNARILKKDDGTESDHSWSHIWAIGICLSGLFLLLTYKLDAVLPVKSVEAEHLELKTGKPFPENPAWWKREWHNWDCQDTAWELFPGNTASVQLNAKSRPKYIKLIANRSGTSESIPVLLLNVCNRYSGAFQITDKQFVKPKNIHEIFLKSDKNTDLMQLLNKWGSYRKEIPGVKHCSPVHLLFTAHKDNGESIILNRVEFEY